MLVDFVKAWDEMFSAFSAGRRVPMAAGLFTLAVLVWGYEVYTDHFELERIAQTARVVAQLGELGAAPSIRASRPLSDQHAQLVRELSKVVLPATPGRWPSAVVIRGIGAVWPFLAVAIIQVIRARRSPMSKAQVGIIVVMVLCAVALALSTREFTSTMSTATVVGPFALICFGLTMAVIFALGRFMRRRPAPARP